MTETRITDGNDGSQPVAILNTSILTADGSYRLEPLELPEARWLACDDIISAVGHQATADLLSTLLEREVPVNRIQFRQEPGQLAIVFKLRGRLEEGKILTPEEIEALGYDLKLLTRTA